MKLACIGDFSTVLCQILMDDVEVNGSKGIGKVKSFI